MKPGDRFMLRRISDGGDGGVGPGKFNVGDQVAVHPSRGQDIARGRSSFKVGDRVFVSPLRDGGGVAHGPSCLCDGCGVVDDRCLRGDDGFIFFNGVNRPASYPGEEIVAGEFRVMIPEDGDGQLSLTHFLNEYTGYEDFAGSGVITEINDEVYGVWFPGSGTIPLFIVIYNFWWSLDRGVEYKVRVKVFGGEEYIKCGMLGFTCGGSGGV